MDRSLFSWESFLTLPVVGILRNIPMEDIMQILPRYQEAGLNTVEVTMNTPDAEGIITYALDRYAGKLNIGAGTVCNLADLKKALKAGAQFIVTPVMDEDVIRTCVQEHVPIFPGAYTPSEIYKAWTLGASLVKLFPATSLGPEYLKELKGPLKQIKVMPTGGINLDNCVAFFNAGAAGLGIGGQLFNENLIHDKNWSGLLKHFKKFIERINTRKTL